MLRKANNTVTKKEVVLLLLFIQQNANLCPPSVQLYAEDGISDSNTAKGFLIL